MDENAFDFSVGLAAAASPPSDGVCVVATDTYLIIVSWQVIVNRFACHGSVIMSLINGLKLCWRGFTSLLRLSCSSGSTVC